jgi:phytanoyl-CoA hydroxylase
MLTREQYTALERDGYVKLGPLYPGDVLEAVRQRIEDLVAGRVDPNTVDWHTEAEFGSQRRYAGPDIPYRQIHRAWRDPVLYRAFCHRSVEHLLSPLMGPDIRIYLGTVFMKAAGHGNELRYHHHGAGRGVPRQITPDAHINLWTALDAASVENGCVRVIPGSHRRTHTIDGRDNEAAYLGDYSQIDPLIAELGEIPVEMAAGESFLLDARTLHASGWNRSGKNRRALVAFYLRADVDLEPYSHEPQEEAMKRQEKEQNMPACRWQDWHPLAGR